MGENSEMRRFKPVYGVVIVVAFIFLVAASDYYLEGSRSNYERVSPGTDGSVRIDIGQLKPGQVRFFRYLNRGNQEVKFFVGRDGRGTVQVAFDASEICFRQKRGFEHQGDWMVCRKCEKAFRLAEVNDGGRGCEPVPLEHRIEGTQLVLQENDILKGWRFFR